jgi:hypothetical protein
LSISSYVSEVERRLVEVEKMPELGRRIGLEAGRLADLNELRRTRRSGQPAGELEVGGKNVTAVGLDQFSQGIEVSSEMTSAVTTASPRSRRTWRSSFGHPLGLWRRKHREATGCRSAR